MEIWNRLSVPPEWAVKTIQAGRLKGKSDINPQWRYQAMTEEFGVCGIGWKYTINRLWTEDGSNDQKMAFAEISLYVKHGETWSNAIPGIGGSMAITTEKNGLYSSDECYKMAVTDALSVALKMLGVGAKVYQGMYETKYDAAPAKIEKQKGDMNTALKALDKNTLQSLGIAAKELYNSFTWTPEEKERLAEVYDLRREFIESELKAKNAD